MRPDAVAGGMARPGEYISLVERGIIRPPAAAAAAGATAREPGPVAAEGRHCWVVGTAGKRHSGLLSEWCRDEHGWHGLVVYVATVEGRPALVQAWIPAKRLRPATDVHTNEPRFQ